ncbi:hypothetical protein PMX39_16085 [Enterocloster clostridioformis]|nr:hypothetical protein [Enterocloster clostridioformis]MDB2134143.1 hypothetical protein [Enterocloster clostridioformis]
MESGKDESTASQVTYFSVKEDARDDRIGYRDVEPQNRMDDWNCVESAPAVSAAGSDSSASFPAVSFSDAASLAAAVVVSVDAALEPQAVRRLGVV